MGVRLIRSVWLCTEVLLREAWLGQTQFTLYNGIKVQQISPGDWASMSVDEFQTFDVLWIGNDDCTGAGAAAFNQAAASRPVWETAIDPGNVMIAGGDTTTTFIAVVVVRHEQLRPP